MNVVIAIIGAVLVVGAIALIIINEYTKNDSAEPLVKNIKPLVAGLVIAGVALFVFGNSFKIIPTNQIGVKSMYGQISDTPAKSGFNFKVPFVQKIETVNCKQQDAKFKEQIWGETSERTPVYMAKTTVTYQINPDYAVWIHKNVSNYNDNLISADIVASALKSAAKTFSAQNVTTRDKIEPLAKEKLQSLLDDKYGKEVVHIVYVVIDDMDFKEEYNAAIAKKSNAQMEYEQAQIDNQKAIEAAEKDKQVKIKEAEGAAESARIKAEGTADATRIKAEAEAEANNKLSKSLTDKVLTHDFYEKWNGKLPQVMDPNANIILDAKE